MCQFEADGMLHDCEISRLGASIESDGGHFKVREQLCEAFIDVIPVIARELDHTES